MAGGIGRADLSHEIKSFHAVVQLGDGECLAGAEFVQAALGLPRRRNHPALRQDDQINPAGVKGLGELGNVGTNAAVCNAVFHATGQRICNLPVRLEKLAI